MSHQGTGIVNIIKSTFAAACGVQSQSNRERDFEHGKPSSFIIAGIAFVLIFVLAMYLLVQFVISVAS